MGNRHQPTFHGELTDKQIDLALSELSAHGLTMTREQFLDRRTKLNTAHTKPIDFFGSPKEVEVFREAINSME